MEHPEFPQTNRKIKHGTKLASGVLQGIGDIRVALLGQAAPGHGKTGTDREKRTKVPGTTVSVA